MADLFGYTDYRAFLQEWFAEQKERVPAFSYRFLTERAGFRNKGFVYNVMHGTRNLSKSGAFKLGRALNLTRAEGEYFENLVAFNQARSHAERDHHYARMEGIKHAGSVTPQAQLVRREQYEFYSTWYHGAVRSLIDMYPVRDDYAWLGRALRPAITTTQARKSVELLERLELIERDRKGHWRVTAKVITSGPEVRSVALMNLHLETNRLAAAALAELPREERNATGLLLGVSRRAYEAICMETEKFQQRILAIAQDDAEADRVYQYNFHLFPLSRTDLKGRTP